MIRLEKFNSCATFAVRLRTFRRAARLPFAGRESIRSLGRKHLPLAQH